MKKIIGFIPAPIRLIFKVYALGIAFFFVLRLVLFFVTFDQVKTISNSTAWILFQAFFMGWRFDTVISGYLLALPMVILSFGEFFPNARNYFAMVSKWIILITYSLAFMVCFADIPLFQQFGNRMNMSAFQWFDSPWFVIKMVFGEIRYWIFLIPLIIFIGAWFYLVNKFHKRFLLKSSVFKNGFSAQKLSTFISLTILFWALLFLGIRGRIEKKSPIRIGTAFFSEYPYVNQLGLNPVFTLMRSFFDQLRTENNPINFMPDEEAANFMQKQLKIDTIIANSPIARQMNIGKIAKPYNVVLVIMESMGSQNMTRYGNSNNLTPTLDSIANHSIAFDFAYTTGIHTHNGLFSTLYSFPSIPKKHPFNEFPINEYTGLPGILKQNSYQTLFFIPHDDQFDNMGGFFKANHFNEIYSEKNYPSEKVLSSLGVPDHVMFDFAINILNRKSESKKPFFATFMTASNHGPYIVPKDISFKPKSSDLKTQLMEYSDWAIANFLQSAMKQPWFKNTLFVFIADHGFHGASNYEMSLCYHHTPFLIYAPEILDSTYAVDKVASQLDVFPTVMGILQIPYINSTLGVDLLTETRKYAPVCNDERMGCVSKDWFFVLREDKTPILYDFNSKTSENKFKQNSNIGQEMQNFTNATYQTTQYLIKLKNTGLIK